MDLCEVVPMDGGHILIGRPWLFDHMKHARNHNTYLFLQRNKGAYPVSSKEKGEEIGNMKSYGQQN